MRKMDESSCLEFSFCGLWYEERVEGQMVMFISCKLRVYTENRII